MLLILAIVCHNIQSDSIATNRLKISYAGYMRASRDALSKCEEQIFKKAKKKKKSFLEKITTVSDEENKTPKKPKKDEWTPSCMHLNLAELVDKQIHQDSARYQLFSHMLKVFYGNTLFKKKPKNFEHTMAEAIIEGIKKQQEELSENEYLHLAKLRMQDPHLQSLFYRMLKGTKNHTYPALLDYISFDPKNKNEKICLACATKELLTALFNESFSDEIWQEKQHDLELLELNAKKLEYLLQRHGYVSTYSLFLPLIKYHHGPSKAKKVTLENEDPGTGITIKRNLYYSSKKA